MVKRFLDKKLILYTLFIGVLFAIMSSLGASLEKNGEVHYGDIGFYLNIIAFTILFTLILMCVWLFVLWLEKVLNKKERVDNTILLILQKPCTIVLVLFLCWLPCYLSTFPGNFVFDSNSVYMQTQGTWNGEYPLLSSVVIVWVLKAVYALTGSWNTGVAVYTVTQMIIIAFIYGHILTTFYKKGVNRIILVILLVYCALFPNYAMLAVTPVRDVAFTVCLAYSMFWFYLMFSDRKDFFSKTYRPIVAAIVFVLALQLRNNAGKIMVVGIIIVGLIVAIVNRQDYLKGSLVFLVTAVVGYSALGIALTHYCQPIIENRAYSTLSICSQTLARVYTYEPGLLTEAELNGIKGYMDVEGMEYAPECADTTKWRLLVTEENKIDFIKFWIKVGLNHPTTYLDGILELSKGMWYPPAVIDGYQNAGWETAYDKSYYWFFDSVEEPAQQIQLLPRVHSFYKAIGCYISFENIPIIKYLFSIGFQYWFAINCLFYAFYRRQRYQYIPLLLILGYNTLAGLLTPLVLMRYYAAMFWSVPIMLVFFIQPTKAKGKIENAD